MFSQVNTEHEIRMVTDVAGLKRAEKWLLRQPYADFGISESSRSHYYYDVSKFRLGQQMASFRQSIGQFNYCLKYVVDTDDIVLTRREVFSRLGYPIDLLHAFHRRFGISVRLLSLLGEPYISDASSIRDFIARVRVDNSRRYRLLSYPNGIDRMLAVAFDTVSAFDISKPNPELIGSWCEVELETVWAFPERLDVAREIASGLGELGCNVTSKSKYSISLERMGAL